PNLSSDLTAVGWPLTMSNMGMGPCSYLTGYVRIAPTLMSVNGRPHHGRPPKRHCRWRAQCFRLSALRFEDRPAIWATAGAVLMAVSHLRARSCFDAQLGVQDRASKP